MSDDNVVNSGDAQNNTGIPQEPVGNEPTQQPEVAKEPTEIEAEAEFQVPPAPESQEPVVDNAVHTFFRGLEVVERLETVNGEGRECKMSDGSTTFVPLDVLGE